MTMPALSAFPGMGGGGGLLTEGSGWMLGDCADVSGAMVTGCAALAVACISWNFAIASGEM